MRSSASEPWERFHLRNIPASPRLEAVAQAPEVASPAQDRQLLPINPKPKRIPEHLRSQVLNLPKDTATSHLVQGQGLIDQEPPKLKRPEPDQKSVQTSQQDFEVIPELLQRQDVMTVPDLLVQSQLHLQVADRKLRSTNRLTADRQGIVRDPGIAHLNRVVSREFSSPHWRHYSDDGKGPRPTYSSMVSRSMTAEVKSSRQPSSAAAGSAEQAGSERVTAPSVKKAGVKSASVVARKTEGHSGAPSSSQTRCSTAPRPSTSKPETPFGKVRNLTPPSKVRRQGIQLPILQIWEEKWSRWRHRNCPQHLLRHLLRKPRRLGMRHVEEEIEELRPLHLLRRHFLRLGSVLSATIGSRTSANTSR